MTRFRRRSDVRSGEEAEGADRDAPAPAPDVGPEPVAFDPDSLPEAPEVPHEPEADLPGGPARPVPARPVSDWSPGAADSEGAVRAAGGVVWTRWGGGDLRIVVVHRPRYDDWSLPKGKADPGETDIACALREVEEETGLVCSLGPELPTTTYRDRHGRPKTVRYWAMQPVAGVLRPQHEIDDARWLPVDEARRLLSYERDAAVVDALVGLEGAPPESPVR